MNDIATVELPPIPADLQVTADLNHFGNPQYLGFVEMLSEEDWRNDTWARKIGQVTTDPKQPPVHGLDNAGCWTQGLGTCVGVAMTFSDGPKAVNQVALVHLTNVVVLHNHLAPETIMAAMLGPGQKVGKLRRVVLAFEYGNPDQPAMTSTIVGTLDTLNVPASAVMQFLDTRPAGARAAVNAALQAGTW
ncbi:MAG: hypothetical protein P4L83_03145 [Nevskia sp.]|nr:hypothetical protein [Nevskia sp.]